MPGFLVHQGATVTCSHLGTASPNMLSAAVSVAGKPVVLMTAQYAVANCNQAALLLPPCVSGVFTTASATVSSFGQPVIVAVAESVCLPTLTPLLVVSTQTAASAR